MKGRKSHEEFTFCAVCGPFPSGGAASVAVKGLFVVLKGPGQQRSFQPFTCLDLLLER